MRLLNFLISKDELRLIFQDKFFSWTIKISLFLIILQTAILFFFWKRIPPEVPFFYSRPWGEEQIAGKEFLFVAPFCLLVFTLVNMWLVGIFFQKEKLLGRIFVFTHILIDFLFTVSFFKILSLTTF